LYDLENKVNQLTELLSELIPTVDRLGRMHERTNLELSEMRISNLKLAEAIEKLVVKVDSIAYHKGTFHHSVYS